jgi:hypothetical protein
MDKIEQDIKIILDSYDMQSMVTNKDFNETFILEYPKFFNEDFCKQIIEKYHFLREQGFSEISDAWSGPPSPSGQWARTKGEHILMNHIETLNLSHAAHVTGECKYFFDTLKIAVQIYRAKYIVSLNPPLTCNDMKVQHIRKGGGFHIWHSEWNKEQMSRFLVYQLYLNTLPEGEGETEFLNQGVRCKPEAGKLLIWPAQWTHTHRGNPNYSTDKYVLTGWIHTNDQTLDYRMEE